MSSSTRAPLTDRQDFQRTDGFALYTDVNDRLMEDLSARDIPQIPEDQPPGYGIHGPRSSIVDENPAGVSLYIAMRHIVGRSLDSNMTGTLYQRYNVTDDDRSRAANFAFADGFGDLDFPWHFSAGLANEVVDYLVVQSKLTQEQKNKFTLNDWANIIGSRWFSRLAHLMALSGNGTYGSFGGIVDDYYSGALAQRLANRNILSNVQEPIFEYSEEEDAAGLRYAAVELSQVAIRGLRADMRKSNSLGCPVARYSVLLPSQLVKTDPHVRALIGRQTLTMVTERSTSDRVRATQERSAIDKTLSLFADQLRAYAANYGTPRMVHSPNYLKINHRFARPANALRRPITIER